MLTVEHVIYDNHDAVEVRRWDNDRVAANFTIGRLSRIDGGYVQFHTLPTRANDPVIDAFRPLSGICRRNALDICEVLAAHMLAVLAFPEVTVHGGTFS